MYIYITYLLLMLTVATATADVSERVNSFLTADKHMCQ